MPVLAVGLESYDDERHVGLSSGGADTGRPCGRAAAAYAPVASSGTSHIDAIASKGALRLIFRLLSKALAEAPCTKNAPKQLQP